MKFFRAYLNSNYLKYLTKKPRAHINYSRNNMGQKCEGNCGLWPVGSYREIILKEYLENLKKIIGAVMELPAK